MERYCCKPNTLPCIALLSGLSRSGKLSEARKKEEERNWELQGDERAYAIQYQSTMVRETIFLHR